MSATAVSPGPPRGRALVVPAGLAVVLLGIVAGCLVLDASATDAQRELYVSERGVVSGSIGALVGLCGATVLAFRPAHRIGVILAGTGVFWAVDGLCESYAVTGLHSDPVLPFTGTAYWIVSEAGAFLLVALPLLLVLYPTGSLPAGRWRGVGAAAVLMSFALPCALALAPDRVVYGDRLPAEVVALLPGVALPLGDAWALGTIRVGQVVTMSAMPVAAAVVFARHSRADGVERTQLRWLLWAALVCLVAGGVMLLDINGPLGFAALVVALVVTSASLVIGVVRPQTGDIDALVGGTLVYAGVALAVVSLDVALLATAGRLLGDRLDERDVTILVLVVAVAAYGPVRSWLTSVVRRRLVGRRGDRYEVVSTLAARLEQSGRIEEQLPELATAVARAFRVSFVRVEVLVRGGEVVSATHGAPPGSVQTFPIAYRGEPVGRLDLPQRGFRAMLSRRDQDLLVDVVRQAAIAVRTSLLTRELQESREQLVLAREEDRRRIRRDLHDGLGPVLGGVAMRLDAAGNAVASDPDTARRLVVQSRAEITEALADVRRLVHGLRPPALDDLGLLAAVEQQAERTRAAGLAVEVCADTLQGLPAAVEVAAYRIVSEALANVARHAQATSATVNLAAHRAELTVEVGDDGRGIAADAVAGVGLRSMRERVEELGGRYEVVCPPEGGTRVRAWLPMTQGVA